MVETCQVYEEYEFCQITFYNPTYGKDKMQIYIYIYIKIIVYYWSNNNEKYFLQDEQNLNINSE